MDSTTRNTNQDRIYNSNTLTKNTKAFKAPIHQAKNQQEMDCHRKPNSPMLGPDDIQWCTGPLRLINQQKYR